MKKTIEKIDMYKKIIGYIVSIIGVLWLAFSFYNNTMTSLNTIQKTTLRTMIWSDGVPMHDRLESCDTYLKLGYNSPNYSTTSFILKYEDRWKVYQYNYPLFK